MIQPSEEYQDSFCSNFDHEINQDTVHMLRTNKHLWAGYPGWDFFGRVWYDTLWHCKVMVYGSEREIISATTPQRLKDKVCSKYGDA